MTAVSNTRHIHTATKMRALTIRGGKSLDHIPGLKCQLLTGYYLSLVSIKTNTYLSATIRNCEVVLNLICFSFFLFKYTSGVINFDTTSKQVSLYAAIRCHIQVFLTVIRLIERRKPNGSSR